MGFSPSDSYILIMVDDGDGQCGRGSKFLFLTIQVRLCVL